MITIQTFTIVLTASLSLYNQPFLDNTTARLAEKRLFENSIHVLFIHFVFTTLSHLAAYKRLNRRLVDELPGSFKSSTSFLYNMPGQRPTSSSSHDGHDHSNNGLSICGHDSMKEVSFLKALINYPISHSSLISATRVQRSYSPPMSLSSCLIPQNVLLISITMMLKVRIRYYTAAA